MHVSIIGAGLIGGSLGLALKKTNWRAAFINCFVRNSEIGEIAKNIGAVDNFEINLVKAVQKADIVIIATPVLTIRDIFVEIAPVVKSGCIITDTASTKLQVLNWAEELLPDRVHFIGGHPMAGKEMSGIQSADDTLFKKAIYCLVRSIKSTAQSISIIEDMVANIGAKFIFMNAKEHDNIVAGISHLPLLVSSALTSVTTKSSYWDKLSVLASSGYYDTTRLASGKPELHGDIVTTNRESIIRWLDSYIEELQGLRSVINTHDDNIYKYFVSANVARGKWLKEYHLRKSGHLGDFLG